MRRPTSPMRKLIVICAATVCIAIGLLTVWTPLPTGVPLLALGIVLLVTVSATARTVLRGARARHGWLDRAIAFVEARAGRNMATMLRRTRPLRNRTSARAALSAANKALRNTAARTRGKGPQ